MKKILAFAAAAAAITAAYASDPLVTTSFTPDPAPYVHGDTVYLFTGHDEDDAQYFKMKDWQMFSSTDMLNWTYRGTPMSTATFAWAVQGDNAWASQAFERNGKVPVHLRRRHRPSRPPQHRRGRGSRPRRPVR